MDIIALRNRLNQLGDYYYLSDGSTLYVRPDQYNAAWNAKRIKLRNKLNQRIADKAQTARYDADIAVQDYANDL